jgi:type III restriction enzyme
VLAKEAISTGWDCPRAEVLYSERPARDATHIAQVIGRMVRQPLAYRIATDDALNSVSCYLPLFDRRGLSSIMEELEGKGKENGENEVGAEVVRAPKVFERNANVNPEVFDLIETLPSIPSPDTTANPLRRAKNLVRLLSDDAGGKALLQDADALLTKTLNSRLDGQAAEHAEAVAANISDIKTATIRTTSITIIGRDEGTSERLVDTHARDIDRDTRRIINAVKEGVGKGYYNYRAHGADPTTNRLDIRVEVAALLMVEGVLAEIEATATKFVQEHLAKYGAEIKNTTGATRDTYRKVQEQTSAPEAITVELRANEKGATKNGEGVDLDSFTGHLYSDGDGRFPAHLNDWETTVVNTEISRPSFVAWYRNPQRATPNSLRIAYQDDAAKWGSLQVDFLIVSRRDDGTLAASIIDPHGDYLADAKAKLRALAGFAENHGNRFVRIESVAQIADGRLRSLDLLDPKIRQAIRDFEGGKVSALYESAAAKPYV